MLKYSYGKEGNKIQLFITIFLYNKLINNRKEVRTMCEVIQFKSGTSNVYNKKLKRFNELKIKYFEDAFIGNDENEFNELEKWLKIHI